MTPAAGPYCDIGSLDLHLRKLASTEFTVFEGQTGGGNAVSSGTYGFAVAPGSYGGGIPADLGLSFTSSGAISVADPGSATFAENGTFTLRVTPAAGPYCDIGSLDLNLRRLGHVVFFWFDNQTAVGTTSVSAAATSGSYTWSKTETSVSLAVSGTGNISATVASASGSSGTDTAFDITIQDGARPASVVGAMLRRRHVDPDPADIAYAAGGGSKTLKVQSGGADDPGPWDFGPMAIAPPALDAALDGVASTNSATTAITWTALDPAGGSGTATFTLAPHDGSAPACTVELDVDVAAQIPVEPDGVDVAILIDRSGSMASQHRWAAAMSGAKIFAELVKEAVDQTVTADPYGGSGTHTWTTLPHRAGLAWFWGRSMPSGGPNFPNPQPPEPGYPDGLHNWFDDAAGDSFRLPDGATLAKTDSISADPPAGTLAQAYHPGHFTALGSGMLFCRNALVEDADPAGVRDRVLLVLSDGIENRAPMLAELFDGSQTGLWYREDGDAAHPFQDPKIRLNAAAVLTGDSWVTRLRNAVAETGGDPALDVKHITDYATSDITLQHWFVSRFKTLFGFDEADAGPDPQLSSGQIATRKIPVTLGHTKLVFYALFNQPDADKWDLGVVPPGQDDAIWFSLAASYHGVRASGGEMHRMIALDLPLAIPEQEHRWAGEWEFVLSRHGAGTGSYAMGVLTRGDGGTGLAVDAPDVPRPGDRVRLRATVTDRFGKPVSDARVMARVREPGPWPGDAVARAMAGSPDMVKALVRSGDADVPSIADRVLRHLQEKGTLGKRRTRTVPLAHAGGGAYQADIRLGGPGTCDIDTTITGYRPSDAGEFEKKLGGAVSGLLGRLPTAALRAERDRLARIAGSKQKFNVELRRQLAVGFLPTEKDSETGGYFVDASTVRLLVQPAGARGVLLGPGWADSIRFLVPGGVKPWWPATDLGDGDYRVDIPVRRVGGTRFDGRLLSLAAERLSLVHPVAGSVTVRDGLLPLAEFAVDVLGVRMPIAVLSLVGDSRTKECHLVTCALADRIDGKSKVWLRDLGQARATGYRPCAECLEG